MRFVINRSDNNFLDTLTFYLTESVLKPTETSKKIQIFWGKN